MAKRTRRNFDRTIKVRWFDNCFGPTGYCNNVRGVMCELAKLCDAKVVTNEQIPKGFEYMATNSDDVCNNTITVCRVFDRERLMDLHKRSKAVCGMLVLEGDKLFEQWIADTNNFCTQVWGVSEFNRQQYINNGIVETLIKVIPHGVNPHIYKTNETLRLKRKGPFRFLFVGGFATLGDRKGADILATAFGEEFKNDTSASLTIKVNSIYNPSFPSEKILKELSGNHPNLNVITRDLNEKERARLYQEHDCIVVPTKGESFGMTIAEGMACGLCSIVTDYGGQLDYCCFNNSYLINVKGFEPATYGQFDIVSGTNWANPDMEHCKQLMRRCVQFPRGTKKIGLNASKFIRKHFTWKQAAKLTYSSIKNL